MKWQQGIYQKQEYKSMIYGMLNSMKNDTEKNEK